MATALVSFALYFIPLRFLFPCGGIDITSACDIRYCTKDASFSVRVSEIVVERRYENFRRSWLWDLLPIKELSIDCPRWHKSENLVDYILFIHRLSVITVGCMKLRWLREIFTDRKHCSKVKTFHGRWTWSNVMSGYVSRLFDTQEAMMAAAKVSLTFSLNQWKLWRKPPMQLQRALR